jgi:uncharacterized protein DUF899
MICISNAPLEKLQAYKQRMGWKFPYVSSFGSDFKSNLHGVLRPAPRGRPEGRGRRRPDTPHDEYEDPSRS